MAGGTWTAQNKARPGIYINAAAKQAVSSSTGVRGTLTMPLALSWGAGQTLFQINAGENVFSLLGYDAESILLLREALKHAKTVLLYRVNGGGIKASVTADGLIATARYAGVRGNDISVAIAADPDEEGKFNVVTYVDGMETDVQEISALEELKGNDFVSFSGTGTPAVTAGVSLTGGTDGMAAAADYAAYLAVAAGIDFDVMAVPTDDGAVKALCAAFARNMRETEGKKIQMVLPDYAGANYEGIISVQNGVVLSDGTIIDKVKAVAWVGGAEAGAEAAKSLTYTEYDGAVSVDTVYTNTEIEDALKAGQLLFADSYGRVVVEQDINTLVTYGESKSASLSKNRVIRTLDGFCNELKRACSLHYIGKIGNDLDGRNTVRAYAIKLASAYQNAGALQNFDAQNDISVSAGASIDEMTLTIALQPVDSVEKIYATVMVGEE